MNKTAKDFYPCTQPQNPRSAIELSGFNCIVLQEMVYTLFLGLSELLLLS
jgi:hypothetical protein